MELRFLMLLIKRICYVILFQHKQTIRQSIKRASTAGKGNIVHPLTVYGLNHPL